jgi:hypothetical protein
MITGENYGDKNHFYYTVVFLSPGVEDRGHGRETFHLQTEMRIMIAADLGYPDNWFMLLFAGEEREWMRKKLSKEGFRYDEKIHIMPGAILSIITNEEWCDAVKSARS